MLIISYCAKGRLKMVINKKSLLLVALLTVSVSPRLTASLATPAIDENENESGRARIVSIMTHDETGIAAYTKKNIQHAETLNIANDLNTNQITEFFGCKTLIGKNYFNQTLQYLVSPQDRNSVVANRQQCIKALVENASLKQEVEKILNEAQQAEQDVITLLSDSFKGRTCPELKGLEMIKEQNPRIFPLINFMHTNPTGKMVSTGISLAILASTAITTGIGAKATYNRARSGNNYSKLAFSTGYLGTLAGLTGYSLYKDYSYGHEKRLKIHALNRFIMLAQKVEALYIAQGIKSQFKISDIRDTTGVELLNKLKSTRYQSKNTVFFNVPAVHSMMYAIYQQQKHLANLFACIAELDAYNALATKILESQHTNNKFCFVSFIDEQKSIIHATGFWNVLVAHAIPNSITEDRNIILTGPNAGGKTTAIRALLQNIVLGQTFGIAAAETFVMTPFDVIHSYLNISDDLINGLSLFASEVKRAQDIVQKIKSLEPHKKYFFALDELFTGTRAEEGEKCAYEFIKRITKSDKVQFIYATHFNKLTELAHDTTSCANYKIDAPTKDTQGNLVYPYTLSSGINQTNVALDIATNANLFD